MELKTRESLEHGGPPIDLSIFENFPIMPQKNPIVIPHVDQ